MWSMFNNGRYIMDVRFLEIEDQLVKVHNRKYRSVDGSTEYYNFSGDLL